MTTILEDKPTVMVEKREDDLIKTAKTRSKLSLLRNEAAVLRAATVKMPNTFSMPFLYDEFPTGYAREFIDGAPLGARDKVYDEFEKRIPELAQYIAVLRHFKPGSLPNDFTLRNLGWLNILSNVSLNQVWGMRAKAYAKDAKYDCSRLLETAKKSDISRMCFNHGEISPWHILNQRGELYLIDSEWASNNFPEHYDAAHLASRLAVSFKSPDAAKTLLSEYRKYLQTSEPNAVNYFDSTIKGLLAIRAIGELRDAGKDLEGRLSFIKELENR